MRPTAILTEGWGSVPAGLAGRCAGSAWHYPEVPAFLASASTNTRLTSG